MKLLNNFFTFIIIALIFIGGCKKEKFGDQQPGNNPPIANAGVDKVIVLPVDSIEIFGSGTDADGTIANYVWRKISGPNQYTLIISTQQNIKIKNLVEGLYKFELKVTDNLGASANDTVNVSVIRLTANNQPPVANAGPDLFITLPKDSVQVNGTATDPDGNIMSIKWSKISGPSSFLIVNSNAAVTKIKNLVAGIYIFKIEATDNEGAISSDFMQIAVASNNGGASPIAWAGDDIYNVWREDSVLLRGSGVDPNGGPLTYHWTVVTEPPNYPTYFTIVNPNSATTLVRRLDDGVYIFKLEVTNNAGLTGSDTVEVIYSPWSYRNK